MGIIAKRADGTVQGNELSDEKSFDRWLLPRVQAKAIVGEFSQLLRSYQACLVVVWVAAVARTLVNHHRKIVLRPLLRFRENRRTFHCRLPLEIFATDQVFNTRSGFIQAHAAVF